MEYDWFKHKEFISMQPEENKGGDLSQQPEPQVFQPQQSAQPGVADVPRFAAPIATVDPVPATPNPVPARPSVPAASTGSSAAANYPGEYVSNPFTVGFRNFAKVITTNPVPMLMSTILLICVLGGFYLLGIVVLLMMLMQPILAALIGIVGFFASLYFFGLILSILFAIPSESTKDNKLSTSEFFKIAKPRTLQMLSLLVVLYLMIVGGLILLIIPGIIFAVRASLAPYILITENVGVIESIKRSFALTKGHFFEVLSSSFAANLLTGNGLIGPFFVASWAAGRYDDLKALENSGAPKPKVHWLNFALPVLTVILIAGYFVLTVISLSSRQEPTFDNSDFYNSSGEFEFESEFYDDSSNSELFLDSTEDFESL